MFLNRYLQKLTKFQLFQLYTVITICIIYPYYLFIDDLNLKGNSNNKNIIKLSDNIKELKKEIIIPKTIKVLKEFEKESKRYKSLKLEDFNIDKKTIKLMGIASRDDFFKFLIFCENYNHTVRIKSLNFKTIDKSKLYSFSFEVKFKKKYIKTLSKEQIVKLEEKTLLSDKSKNANKLQLQAILGDQVIINNKLLSKGDTYNKYKIKDIKKEYIILLKDSKIKKIYIKENTNE